MERTWRDLLGSWIEDSHERLRLTQAIGVSPQTLSRWVHTEMNPQPQKLLKLLAALTPAQQKQIQPLLPMTSSLIATNEECEPLPQEFYVSVLHAAAALPKTMLFNTLARMIIEQAVRRLDPDGLGIAIAIAKCQPPSLSGKVRSLYEVLGRGTPPWPTFLEQHAMFRGAESLAGSALVTGHVMTAKRDTQSVAAAPIMRMGAVAGSLLVESVSPDFFSFRRLQVVEHYAELLTVAFLEEQFYDLADIHLGIMPNEDVQRSCLSLLKPRVMQVMMRDQQSLPQAEREVRQSIEEELLERARS